LALASSFYGGLLASTIGAAAAILAYDGKGCGLGILELGLGEEVGRRGVEGVGTRVRVSWEWAGLEVAFIIEPV
jgi:hypothetical protein